ncbi:MAG: hypothetical protein U9Q83_03445 [Bacteroidota bacterium]|nr:hypothetical protein [Bacteroidota bacterium]
MKKVKFYFGLAFTVLFMINIQLNAQFFKSKIDTLKMLRTLKISQTEKYSIRGTSLNFLNIQDTKMTPMIYSGPGIGFNLSSYKTIKNYTHFTGFNFHYSTLFGPDKISLSYMHGLKFRFNTGKLYQLNSNNWKIGASSNIETNSRIYLKNGNDPVGTEILSTINFAGSYSFDYKQNKIEIRAELPLFAYVMRFPDYNIFGFNHLFMPLGIYNSIRTKFIIVKPLKYSSENHYSISYEWDLYTFKEYDKYFKIVSGTHFITFSYWLKKM